MGSPAFAVPALRALHAAGHEIACVYSQPPRPAGRGHTVAKAPVHVAAEELGLAVRTPARLKRDEGEHAAFAALRLDAAAVAAYGLILPEAMLGAPLHGCLNIHASLLPRWRGAAPIQAAILAGDSESGITIMRMDAGLDTGPMLSREAVPIGARMTTPQLHDALAELGARLVVRALADMPEAVPQPADGVTYAAKLTRADGKVDWQWSATQLDRQIRALNPWPGTFTMMGGETVKLLAARPVSGFGPHGRILAPDFTVACGEGALLVERAQRAGRPAMPGAEFLRGVPDGLNLTLS
jgi:methionyl-tRNA formyltransferase